MSAEIKMFSPRSRSVSQASDELFLDPVSHEPMLDSLIDECGHTFDRSTIKKMIDQSKKLNAPIICPLSRKEIDVNALRPNRLVNEASKKYHVFRKDSSDNKEDEDSDNLSLHDKLNLLIKMNFKLQHENHEFKKEIKYLREEAIHAREEITHTREELVDMRKNNLLLQHQIEDLTEKVQDLRDERHRYKSKYSKSKKSNENKEKELQAHKEFNRDILNMSVKERFEVFVGSVAPCCDHLRTLKAQMESKKFL